MIFDIPMKLKRNIYVFMFTLFGLLFGLFVASMTEVVYIKLLMQDFVTYSFGLTWDELNQFGFIFAAVLTVACGAWGYAAGKYWWKQIYVLKRYGLKT
ncbi:MAG: hypothetical protein KW802_00295 [Candidatus Doudnabacteria bacterium]|nr:hypothetical protein [Candidatus Doudnabacteria bacterium]